MIAFREAEQPMLEMQAGDRRVRVLRHERDADKTLTKIRATAAEREAVELAAQAIRDYEAGLPGLRAWQIIDEVCPSAQADHRAQSRADELMYAAAYKADAKRGFIGPVMPKAKRDAENVTALCIVGGEHREAA